MKRTFSRRDRDMLGRRMDELETIIAAGRIGYCKLDASARVLAANAQFKAHFAWSPDDNPAWGELLARVSAEDRESLQKWLDAAIAEATELDILLRVSAPEGGARYIRLNGRAVCGDDGAVEYLLIVTSDVTVHQKRIDDAVEAQSRCEFMLDLVTRIGQASDAHELARVAAERLGEYLGAERVVFGEVDTSSGTLKTLGIHRSTDASDLEAPEISFELAAAAVRARESAGDMPSGERTTRQDEERAEARHPRSMIAVPLYRQARWAGVLIVDDAATRVWSAQDIALVESVAHVVWSIYEREVKSAAAVRAERQQRTAAEQANRSKDEFLSMFSHELRSPLNAILGWNQILSVKRASDPEVVAITARIDRSAKTQLKMVNDLLDLGRISTGKLKIETLPIKLANVVAAAIEVARPPAAAKGIEILADLDSTRGEMHGDADRLQQVIWNVLSNAIKFTGAGGRIGVGLRRTGDWLELSISDTGQGIAPELLPHVFDRFRQGDNSTTRHAGGLGLGLAVVREIVTLHGGTVSVSSEGIGHGATFTIRLPAPQLREASSDERDRRPREPSTHSSLSGLSILVVDDEADARAVVAETLRLEGADVTVSDSAGSALAQLRADGAHFDVVVTDIGMPIEDGYSLIRKLRSLQLGQRVVAIALTGYASYSDKRAALEAGFDVHVAKPVDFDDFIPLIRRMARHPRA